VRDQLDDGDLILPQSASFVNHDFRISISQYWLYLALSQCVCVSKKTHAVVYKKRKASYARNQVGRDGQLQERPELGRERDKMFPQTRQYYLQQAEAIIRSGSFTKEQEARVRALTHLAQVASDEKLRRGPVYASEAEARQFREFLHTGKTPERRDIGAGAGSYPGSSGSGLVPVGFRNAVVDQLKLTDQLWDDTLTTILRTPRGSAYAVPLDSDVANEAVVISENASGASADEDLLMGILALEQCPTWRASCYVSVELVSDSGIELDAYLARRFAVRYERGFGPVLVSTLIAGAAATVTAGGAGASNQTAAGSTSASTSVGSDDLTKLAQSLDGTYLERASWVMRPATYLSILGIRASTTGLRVFHEQYDADGNPLLLGKRVVFAPSVDGIGASKQPVVFGDLSRLIIREAGEMTLAISAEKRPESGQLYYRSTWRLQAATAIDSTLSPADQPFVVLTLVS